VSCAQGTIVGCLKCCHRRLNLGATCITLHQASLEWFPDVIMRTLPADDEMPALKAWLKRHQGELLQPLLLPSHCCVWTACCAIM
jgi:hypothetical protein